MIRHHLVASITLLLLAGCASQGPVNAPSTHGVSVAAHPEAAKAGAQILEEGGNAVDAAIATGFAIAVVEPTMNSVGGRSLVMLHTPEGQSLAYQAMTEVPSGYVRPEEPVADGYGVIATPGVVAALGRIHKEHGSLAWDRLLAPAIELAENGFVLLPGEARRQAGAKERYKDNPGFQAVFLKEDGSNFEAGETIRQPDLARTLRTIATEGARSFYEGGIAAQITEDMTKNDGWVTAEDLAGYVVQDGRYITTRYRDYDIHVMAAPGGGGLVVKALNMMENFDLASMSDTSWATVVNQALAISFNTMRDDYRESDLNKVVSKDVAKDMAAQIRVPEIADSGSPATSTLIAQHDWDGSSWGPDSHHTTHFVTADCNGMSVSITQTIGPVFGSKVITPGLGFVYATTMGTYLNASDESPGSRPRTTISPTIVTKDGKVEFVLGAAGGLRIASGIVQTISRYADQGMSLEDAVAAPRIHPKRTVDEETGFRTGNLMAFHAETTPGDGWSETDLANWQAAGFDVEGNERVGAFARVHAAAHRDGAWYGVADPDWEGKAIPATESACSRQ